MPEQRKPDLPPDGGGAATQGAYIAFASPTELTEAPLMVTAFALVADDEQAAIEMLVERGVFHAGAVTACGLAEMQHFTVDPNPTIAPQEGVGGFGFPQRSSPARLDA